MIPRLDNKRLNALLDSTPNPLHPKYIQNPPLLIMSKVKTLLKKFLGGGAKMQEMESTAAMHLASAR